MIPTSLTPFTSQVIPGVSRRNSFALVPSKVALLIIDIQDHLSSRSSSDKDDNTQSVDYLFDTALPRAIPNMVQLVNCIRTLRDRTNVYSCASENSRKPATPPEVVFTFLQSLTDDARDISLDYKLSGQKLSTLLPNPSQPATFLTLPAELQPSTCTGRGDILIPKTSCSVFQSTNIAYILRNLSVEQLILCGQLTNQCVESAARDAADLGFLVTVAEDACAAKSYAEHEQGLHGMSGFVRILSTDSIVQELLHYYSLIPSTDESILPKEVLLVNHDLHIVSKPSTPQSSHHLHHHHSMQAGLDAMFYALDYAGVKFLRLASVDISNAIRTKAVPLSTLFQPSLRNKSSNLYKKLNHIVTIAQVSMAGLPQYADTILPESELDAKKVLALHPDLSTLRILPYATKSAMVLCSLWDKDSISPFCTRNILSQVIETAKRDFQIGFSVGVEFEFCLFHRPDSNSTTTSSLLLPVDHSLFCYPTILNQQEEYISEVCHALAKQRIQVDLVHAESAYGQLELVLPYENDALKIADHIVLARETMIEMAKKKNLCALFLPKIYPDQAGNGMHLHLSIWDTVSGDNIFPGSSSYPGSISPTGQSFMEGILQHMPALLALTNPTRNSFRRIGKGCWTGSTCSWDIEDKEVPMRVCLDSESGLATNVEYKLSDSTANVYLQIAALLSAGLDGIRRKLELRPALSSSHSSNLTVELPSTLPEALDLLFLDECLSHMLGDKLLRSYMAVKRAEYNQPTDLSQEVMNALKRAT